MGRAIVYPRGYVRKRGDAGPWEGVQECDREWEGQGLQTLSVACNAYETRPAQRHKVQRRYHRIRKESCAKAIKGAIFGGCSPVCLPRSHPPDC